MFMRFGYVVMLPFFLGFLVSVLAFLDYALVFVDGMRSVVGAGGCGKYYFIPCHLYVDTNILLDKYIILR